MRKIPCIIKERKVTLHRIKHLFTFGNGENPADMTIMIVKHVIFNKIKVIYTKYSLHRTPEILY